MKQQQVAKATDQDGFSDPCLETKQLTLTGMIISANAPGEFISFRTNTGRVRAV